MLSISLIPNSIKSQHSELEKVQYWQNLGDDLNVALFCSIMHYFLNQKNFRPIYKFLNISNKGLKADYIQMHKLITQTLEANNPIQQFFDYVSQIRRNISQIGQFLDELCRIHLLKKQDKPNLNGLTIFLQVRINFLHNKEKYGQGQEEILISQYSNNFYFIIPPPQLRNLPRYQCNICNEIENCLQMNCHHNMCLNCIQISKQNSQKDYFLCNCDQIVLKNSFLDDAIREIKNLQEINNYISSINNYYEFIIEDHLKTEKEQDSVQKRGIQNDFLMSEGTHNQGNRKNNQQKLLIKSDGYFANDSQNKQYHYSSQNNSNDNRDVIKQQKLQRKTQSSHDHFQEEPSKSFDLIGQIAIIEPSQQIQKYSQIYSDKCTYCLSTFDNYNLKQDISCPQHQIGACCIYAIYQQCPQCENIYKNLNANKFLKFTSEIKMDNDIAVQNGQNLQQEYQTQAPTMQEIYGKNNFAINDESEIQNKNDNFYIAMTIRNEQIVQNLNQKQNLTP